MAVARQMGGDSAGHGGEAGGRKIERWRARDGELSQTRRALIKTETTRWPGDSAGRRGEGHSLEGRGWRGGPEMEGEGWRTV